MKSAEEDGEEDHERCRNLIVVGVEEFVSPGERRHVNIAAVALAAKHARIAWAILAKGTEYRPARLEEAAA